jgi:FkbM family methyltransferase
VIEREPAFKWVLRQELQELKLNVKNPVLMDIGANVGDYTILMDEYFGETPHQMVAIEPDPNTFELLKSNLDFHEVGCFLDWSAITDNTGTAVFYAAAKNNLSSLIYRNGVAKKRTKVACSTIGDVLKKFELDKVHLIKMDIEGGEVLALRGARDFFENGAAPKILMETHQLQYTKDLSLEEELKFLFSSGWHCRYMVSTALPDFYSGYKECLPARGFEVKPGWKRLVFYAPTDENVIRYACWPDEIGIPTWHGTLSGKLIRALLLWKCD